jgi:hypothetical protein
MSWIWFVHSFLKLSKIDISERFQISFLITGPAVSISDKKSPRPAGHPEHRVTDLRRQTKMKCPSLRLEDCDLSSLYLLKLSKFDISENLGFVCAGL